MDDERNPWLSKLPDHSKWEANSKERPNKIYEFTYSDTYNSTMSEIIHTLEDFILSEADIQGWKDGYTVSLSLPIERKGGELKYHFEVYGEFIERAN